MMMAIENPKLSLEELILLEKKIQQNLAEKEDYERLESYLSSMGIGKDYILSELKKYNIFSIEEYALERKKPKEFRNTNVDGYLVGMFIGIISALKNHITNT